MLGSLNRVRPEERRVVAAAAGTLLGTMFAHALAETARDALFLASVPAARLPWVYLGVAVAAVLLVRLQRAVFSRGGPRGTLVVALLACAAVTAGFWVGLRGTGTAALYALYVWSGVQSTMLVVHLYVLLGGLFTVRQAKRLYGAIGLGAIVGAMLGSAAANAVTRIGADRHLLLAAAVALAITSIPAALLPARGGDAPPDTGPWRYPMNERAMLRVFVERPYARQLAAVVVVSAMALTAADYVFKWVVADRVAAADLGMFFSGVYLAVNVVGVLVQAFVTGPVVRRLGVTQSLLVLPLFLAGADVALLAGGGLAAAIARQGIGGTLRHTLNRNALELLYVPMPDAVRHAIKDLIDIAGHRGGQAVASLAILGLVAWRPGVLAASVLLAVLLAAWVALAFTIHAPYLDVYRRTLRQLASTAHVEFPALDLASLETLIATLNSPNDREVLAALDILAEQDKAHLVPALILYHPSSEVVVRALSLFARSGRTAFVPVADRLLGTTGPDVHAAIVRARMAVAPDHDLFHRLLDSTCPGTRTTAIVALHVSGDLDEAEARRRLVEAHDIDPAVSARSVARAVHGRSTPLLDELLCRYARHPDLEVRREVVGAMATLDAPDQLPVLVWLLSDIELREGVRQALLARGAPALGALATGLSDGSLDVVVRWEIPATIARFPAARSAPLLVRHLLDEPDGMMEYRILRALEALQRVEPETPIERASVLAAAERTLHEAAQLLDWRLAIERAARAEPALAGGAHDLLVRLLHDKERHAVERGVRLGGLLVPREDFDAIVRGLQSGSARARSSGAELLELVVEPRLRTPLAVLIDDSADEDRLQALAAFHPSDGPSYGDALGRMLDAQSSSVRTLAVARVGEMQLAGWAERLRALESRGDAPLFDDVLVRALGRLEAAAK